MAKKLVIFLATALPQKKNDGTFEDSHLKDFAILEEQVKNAPFSDDIDVLIVLETVVGNTKDQVVLLKTKRLDGLIQRQLDGDQIDLGRKELLISIFNECIQLNQPEIYEQKVLVTWDHGYGHLMFQNELNPMVDIFFKFKSQTFAFDENDLLRISNAMRQAPGSPDSALTMNELADAIQDSDLKKFDLIIMSNCYMQNVDTFFALRGATHLLFSPQTYWVWDSYNFQNLLTDLNSRQDIVEISMNLIPSIIEMYNAKKNIDKLALTGISLLDTTNAVGFFNDFIDAIELLNNFYDKSPKVAQQIFDARMGCLDITYDKDNEAQKIPGLKHIDLFLLFECLAETLKDFKNGEIARACIKMGQYKKDAPTPIVVNYFVGPEIIEDDKKSTDGKKSPTGISLPFPKNITELEKKNSYSAMFTNSKSDFLTRFCKKTGWNIFLENFLHYIK